jgi:hypothetical protein
VTSAPTGGKIKYAKSHHKKAKGFGLSGRTRTTKNKSKHQPSNHANPLKQCKQCKQSHPSTHPEETKEKKKVPISATKKIFTDITALSRSRTLIP